MRLTGAHTFLFPCKAPLFERKSSLFGKTTFAVLMDETVGPLRASGIGRGASEPRDAPLAPRAKTPDLALPRKLEFTILRGFYLL